MNVRSFTYKENESFVAILQSSSNLVIAHANLLRDGGKQRNDLEELNHSGITRWSRRRDVVVELVVLNARPVQLVNLVDAERGT